MANKILRSFWAETNIPFYEFANMVDLSDSYFSKILRNDLPEDVQRNLITAMEQKLNGQKPDLSVWGAWRKKQAVLSRAKRNDKQRKYLSAISAWRKENAFFDDVEERRIKGGWDTWQG